jgi:hypothetical protein
LAKFDFHLALVLYLPHIDMFAFSPYTEKKAAKEVTQQRCGCVIL